MSPKVPKNNVPGERGRRFVRQMHSVDVRYLHQCSNGICNNIRESTVILDNIEFKSQSLYRYELTKEN